MDYGATGSAGAPGVRQEATVSATAGGADNQDAGRRLGLQPGMVVQELGWDEDVDEDVRASIEAVIAAELVDEDYGDVADAVILWWREDDGDLVDALVDALTDLADGGVIWLFTPKVGRPGYVDASDVSESAPTAGLATTTSLTIGKDWAATKLVAPKAARASRR